MSKFWTYFHDTLRFPLIHRPGTLAGLVRGGAAALDAARDNILWLRDQFAPEKCEPEYLDRLAVSRGLRRWPGEDDDFWRARVVHAYRWFKRGGTRPGMEEFFKLAGVEAEIIEAHEADYGGVRLLDGAWSLDGTVGVAAYDGGLIQPYLNWAEFGIRVNLAAAQKAGWLDLIKTIVGEFKPARSLPKYFYNLSFVVPVDALAASYLKLTKDIDQVYPWENTRLDGSWVLGRDDQPYCLDGSLLMDGSWLLGGVIPGSAGERIKQADILGNLALRKYVIRPDDYITMNLGERLLRLDGVWRVGGNGITALSGARNRIAVKLENSPVAAVSHNAGYTLSYPAEPVSLGRLKKLEGFLDGSWRIGSSTLTLNDLGVVRRGPGLTATETKTARISSGAGIANRVGGPNARIGARWSRKINGVWTVGAANRLDGGWTVDGGCSLSAPNLGFTYNYLDASWALGFNKRLSDLAIGHKGPECLGRIAVRTV